VVATDSAGVGSLVSDQAMEGRDRASAQDHGHVHPSGQGLHRSEQPDRHPAGGSQLQVQGAGHHRPAPGPSRAQRHHRRCEGQALARPDPGGPGLVGDNHRADQLRARSGLLPDTAVRCLGRPASAALRGDAFHRAGSLPQAPGTQGPSGPGHHRGARGVAERVRGRGRGGVHHQRARQQLQLPHRHQPLSGAHAAVPAVGALREPRRRLQPEPGRPRQLRVGPPGAAARGRGGLLLPLRGRGDELGGRHQLHHLRRVAERAGPGRGCAGSAASRRR
jgi:hypothetical protein